jgi:molybdenum cofactor cytidylyltransferase
MGEQKLLLPYGEGSIITTVLHHVLRSQVDSVHLILGADQERIREEVKSLPVKICFNPDHRSGMLSSVICGWRSLPEKTGGVLIFLGDQPHIPPGVSNAILEAYHRSHHDIVVPRYGNRKGHPLLVDYLYKEEIERLDPEVGLRSLMHRFPEDVLELDMEEPGILLDIDTPDDYKNAR